MGVALKSKKEKKKIRLLKQSQRLKRQPRVGARLNGKVYLIHKNTFSRLRAIAISPNTQKQTELSKMRRQRNMFQTKEQDKISE